MRTFSLFATDFYKLGHIRQYPENTTLVYSNLTPRSDRLLVVCSESIWWTVSMS